MMEGLIVCRDVIEKARQHKYLRKTSDGKGGFIYIYKEVDNKKESINFNKIKDYADEVISGRKRIDGFSLGEQKGCVKGGRRNVECTVLITTIKGTDKDGIGVNKEREDALVAFAKKEGIWVDDFDKKYNEENKFGEGAEAKVYVYDEDNVIKRVDYGMVHDDSILDFFHRIAAHNLIFHDTKYELLGFTKGGFGVSPINVLLKQKTIKNILFATRSEVKKRMLDSGFKYIGGDSYSNFRYEVHDLEGKNVFKDKNGRLFFIDPIINIKKDEDMEQNIRKSMDGRLIIYTDVIEKAK